MTILIVIAAVVLYGILFHYAKEWIHGKVREPVPEGDADDYYRKFPQCKEYIGEEHEWKPVHKLEHHAVTTFNIPFVPEDTEIFYMENNYDEEANLFVKENIDLIRELLHKKWRLQ